MPLTWQHQNYQHGNYQCTIHVVSQFETQWSVRYLLPGAGDHWAKKGKANNQLLAMQMIDREIEQAELGRIGA